MSQPKSELIKLYQDILSQNGIEEIVIDLNVVVPPLEGEHLASASEYVTLKTNSGKDIELFTKKMPTNAQHSQLLKDMNVFPKEAAFYNSLLKDMQEVYKDKTGSATPLDFFPKCLFANDEMIVMENLAKKGYELLSKREKQDLDTAKIVLKNLAQLHAVTYVMVFDMGKGVFFNKYKFLEENFVRPNKDKAQLSTKLFTSSIENSVMFLENSDVPGKEAAIENLLRYRDGRNVDAMIEALSHDSLHLLFVANHGDCWNNNMMFHRDPLSNKLTHNVMLDFQLARLGSPNLDVGYFLFTSVKPEVRRKEWKTLLRFYFDHLRKMVDNLGKTFNYTFDEFVKDYRVKSMLGFWMNLAVVTGMEILAEVDLANLQEDLFDRWNSVMRKWMEANPRKSTEVSKEIVALVEEFFGEHD
jgi:hypothetical protein